MEEQFETKFHRFEEVQRRDPSFYMKNPTKTYCMTHGNQDYVYKDKAKGGGIENHDNRCSPRRHDYRHMIPQVPQMAPCPNNPSMQQDAS